MRYSLVLCLLLAVPAPGRPQTGGGAGEADSPDRPANPAADPGTGDEWTFFYNGREYTSESMRELQPQPTSSPGSRQSSRKSMTVIVNPELLEMPHPGDTIGYRLRSGEKAAEEVSGVISDDNVLALDNGIHIPVTGMNIYEVFGSIRSVHRRLRIPDYGYF